MDVNDQKVRKQWLLVFVTYSLMSFVISCVISVLSFTPRDNGIFSILPAAIGALVGLGVSFLIYRCIYKKPGTKLLTFLLITGVISLVSMPVMYLSGKLSLPACIPYPKVYLLLTGIMSIHWLIMCWKMRKTNQKLQKLA